jgi:GT2 family glycosyltransferase
VTHGPVAVVILNWNGWQDTLACLESLDTLEGDRPRIIVVDNGSTNDSAARIAEARPDVELIRSERNLGFAGGTNLGIRHALAGGAAFVWLLNNDTVVAPDALETLLEPLLRDERVGAAASVILEYDDPSTVQVWGGGGIHLWTGWAWLNSDGAAEPGFLNGTSLVLRGAALAEVGLFDETYFLYWEDADLSLRLKAAGWRLAVAEGSRVRHKGAASTGGFQSVEAYSFYTTSALRFFRRHSAVPFLPNAVRTAGGALKWILVRDWPRLRALLGAGRRV